MAVDDTPAQRTAVITGASSGIGRACARALAAHGFAVVAAGRRLPQLREVCDAIEADGGTALPVQCDVRDEASVTRLFDAAVDRFGRVDLLFNNAGVFSRPTPIEDLTLGEWHDAVATNLTGAFLCTRAAVRQMREQRPQGGRIINNGSISAHSPRPDSVAYTATKHAITGLTRSTALDGRRHHIACGQIDIGNAATAINQDGAVQLRQPDGSTRIEPTMAVDDVARAVGYMASLPLDANVLSLTVMATAMPFVGRG
ncbi:MAG TPA: SDR family oxidoreductase [Jatrophihabitantaceae bacterium]|jgi:NAD(P)-dependent dehydrogenase (short-subunit alcohol dehydrogenase family)